MQVVSSNTVQDFFCFLKEKPSLISLILSTKSEKKHDCCSLQWAQTKLRSKVYTNPAQATSVFEEDLLNVMELASEARIPDEEGRFYFVLLFITGK